MQKVRTYRVDTRYVENYQWHLTPFFKGLGEWARQESNLRLPPCEDGTLAAELRAHQRQGFVTRRSDQWVP